MLVMAFFFLFKYKSLYVKAELLQLPRGGVRELQSAILAKSVSIGRLRELQSAILLFHGNFNTFYGNKTL
ncbi:hypothetical protein GCM10008018_20050 [Paenibacillus marchantiophytorum]|uniref:Uncharacterized protein n=1 Tax=Paenibacillus marchantiophytorum TaxID=1619310 RepID=A0ABQ2BUY6_9BACL|nr:hypothetical protein GCM10008018_20050 [Paenibacillus marchantiophytorum]